MKSTSTRKYNQNNHNETTYFWWGIAVPDRLEGHLPYGMESLLSGTKGEKRFFINNYHHHCCIFISLYLLLFFSFTLDSAILGDRPTPLLRLFLFLSTWCCLRLFCTAKSNEMNEFFNSFSSSSSSRNASSAIRVSENSLINTSSSRYNSFSCDTLNVFNSEREPNSSFSKTNHSY